jgi:hypothetical protein
MCEASTDETHCRATRSATTTAYLPTGGTGGGLGGNGSGGGAGAGGAGLGRDGLLGIDASPLKIAFTAAVCRKLDKREQSRR